MADEYAGDIRKIVKVDGEVFGGGHLELIRFYGSNRSTLAGFIREPVDRGGGGGRGRGGDDDAAVLPAHRLRRALVVQHAPTAVWIALFQARRADRQIVALSYSYFAHL